MPNQDQIFAIYAITLLMYTVASPDPLLGGGQLPKGIYWYLYIDKEYGPCGKFVFKTDLSDFC